MNTSLRIVKKFFPKVESVVDAKKPARIHVTNEDCASQGKKSHTTCAMAVACKRSFHLDGVIISHSIAYLIKGKHARRFQVPLSVTREITAFDRGAKFSPGDYQLGAVRPAKRIGAMTGGNRRSSANGKLAKFRHITDKVRTVLGGELPQSEKA